MLFFVSAAGLSSAALADSPVAEAGLGLLAYVGDTVILDGSGSYDPDGDPIVYTWSQVGGPPVVMERTDAPEPRFEVAGAGTLRFSLVVNDGESDSPPDVVEVVVPHEEIRGVEAGCSAVPGAVGLLGATAGLLLVARRRR